MARNRNADLFNANVKAQRVAARLPLLDLEASKLASLIMGEHRRSVIGSGDEPHSLEEFRQGFHDPARINARASARSQDRDGDTRWLVLNREKRVSHEIYLWRDASRSMDVRAPRNLFPEQPEFSKREEAEILMLAVAHMAVMRGEHYTMLGSDLGLTSNRAGIDRILATLDHDRSKSDLPKLPIHRGRPLKENSVVFIFSDFLPAVPEDIETLDELKEELHHVLADVRTMIHMLHRQGVHVHLIQTLDPSEIEWRYRGHIRFEDAEGGHHHIIKKAEKLKEPVENMVRQHIDDLNKLVNRVPGWTFSTHVTNRPRHEALLPLFGFRHVNPVTGRSLDLPQL